MEPGHVAAPDDGRRAAGEKDRTVADEQGAPPWRRDPRVAWSVGLGSLLAWAAVLVLVGARVGQDEFQIPPAVLEYEQAVSGHAAESVRRSLNQGVDDLVQFARNAEGFPVPTTALEDELRVLTDVHDRYAAVYVLDGDGGTLASVGSGPVPQAVPPGLDGPGMADLFRLDDGVAVLPQYSPLRDGVVVGHYDPEFLQFPLSVTEPGGAWIVDAEGRVVFGLDGAAILSELPGAELQFAAERAARGETGARSIGEGFDDGQIVAFAPITGEGPGGELGWGVVSSREAASMPSQVAQVRQLSRLGGTVLALVAILVFLWLQTAYRGRTSP
jgi:hypothetical protein